MKKTICYTLVVALLAMVVTACGKSDEEKRAEADKKSTAYTFKKSEQKSY